MQHEVFVDCCLENNTVRLEPAAGIIRLFPAEPSNVVPLQSNTSDPAPTAPPDGTNPDPSHPCFDVGSAPRSQFHGNPGALDAAVQEHLRKREEARKKQIASARTARFIPPMLLPKPEIPEGYAPHPVVKDGMINGNDLPLGPTVIDYVALQSGISVETACINLKDKLEAGRLQARGPDGLIPAEFWEYAVINPSGEAHSLKAKQTTYWFKLRAPNVLTLWPPPPEWVVPPPDATVEPIPPVAPTPLVIATVKAQPETADPQEQPAPAPTTADPAKEQKRKFNEKGARALLTARKITDWKNRPTEKEVEAFLLLHFEPARRNQIRQVLHDTWPGPTPRGRRKKTNPPAN